jgi:hypothetical protein
LGALDDHAVIEFTINTGTSAFSFLESPIAIGYVFENKFAWADGKPDVWKPNAVNGGWGMVPLAYFVGEEVTAAGKVTSWNASQLDTANYRIRITDFFLMGRKVSFGDKSALQ